MPEALYFQELDSILYLSARGHITAALCADLRELAFARFDRPPAVRGMYVDLSACDYMDSTFMGLLVGFNKRLMKAGALKLVLLRPTATARELLEGLGLTGLVEIRDEAVPFPGDMENILKTRNAGADLLLKAHENLMELNEENRKKFAALHSVLKGQQQP